MKGFARVSLLLLVVSMAAGPVMAATVTVHGGPTISAPASHDAPSRSPLALVGYALAALGMARIKDAGSLAKKFSQRAAAAAGDYAAGVAAAGGDWEANAAAGEDNYKIAVTDAAAKGRFGKGVRAAGAAKYVDRAKTLGAQRFPSGVQAAEGSWAQATQPYLQTLGSINLPPRRPKGDPGNMARVQVIADTLRKQKAG